MVPIQIDAARRGRQTSRMLIAALLLIAAPEIEDASAAWRACTVRVAQSTSEQGMDAGTAVMLAARHCRREAQRYLRASGGSVDAMLNEQGFALQDAAEALNQRRSKGQ